MTDFTPLTARLRELHRQMVEFATTRPSPQQTRQKSAREMVEHFAYDLDALLASAAPTRDEGLLKAIHGETHGETYEACGHWRCQGPASAPMTAAPDLSEWVTHKPFCRMFAVNNSNFTEPATCICGLAAALAEKGR